MPLRVGILGARRALFMVGCRVAFPEQLVLAGVCDIRPERAEQAARQHSIDRTYPTYEAMLA